MRQPPGRSGPAPECGPAHRSDAPAALLTGLRSTFALAGHAVADRVAQQPDLDRQDVSARGSRLCHRRRRADAFHALGAAGPHPGMGVLLTASELAPAGRIRTDPAARDCGGSAQRAALVLEQGLLRQHPGARPVCLLVLHAVVRGAGHAQRRPRPLGVLRLAGLRDPLAHVAERPLHGELVRRQCLLPNPVSRPAHRQPRPAHSGRHRHVRHLLAHPGDRRSQCRCLPDRVQHHPLESVGALVADGHRSASSDGLSRLLLRHRRDARGVSPRAAADRPQLQQREVRRRLSLWVDPRARVRREPSPSTEANPSSVPRWRDDSHPSSATCGRSSFEA